MFSYKLKPCLLRQSFCVVCTRGVRGRKAPSQATVANDTPWIQKALDGQMSTISDAQTLNENFPQFGSLSGSKMRELAQSMQESVKSLPQTKMQFREPTHMELPSVQDILTETDKQTPKEVARVTEEDMHAVLANSIVPYAQYDYPRQLQMKERRAAKVLKDLEIQLREVGAPDPPFLQPSLPCPLQPIIPSAEINGYRNKDDFVVNVGVDGNPKTVGFMTGAPRLPASVCVPPTRLPHLRPAHKEVAAHFQAFIRSSRHDTHLHYAGRAGVWRNITVRSNMAGDLMLLVGIHPHDLTAADQAELEKDLVDYMTTGPGAALRLTSLYLQSSAHRRATSLEAPLRLLHGAAFLTETCAGASFRVEPDTFCPANIPAFEAVHSTIREIAAIGPQTTVIHVYCGNGLLSVLLAGHARGCVGLETAAAAVAEASSNAARNDAQNCEFMTGEPDRVLQSLHEELCGLGDVMLVVSGGRSGLSPRLLQRLRAVPASRLVYLTSRPEAYALRNFISLGNCLKSSKMRHHAPLLPRYAFTVDTTPHSEAFDMGVLFERHSKVV